MLWDKIFFIIMESTPKDPKEQNASVQNIATASDPYDPPDILPDNGLFGYWTGRILAGETIEKSWGRYKKQLPKILIFSLTAAGPAFWYLEAVKNMPAYSAYFLLLPIAILILVIYASLMHIVHKDEGLVKALAFGIHPKNFINIMAGQMFIMASTIGGLGAFIVPGLSVFAWGLFAPFIYIDEKKIGFTAMGRSRDYAEGHVPGITITMFPLLAGFILLAFPDIILHFFGIDFGGLSGNIALILNIARFIFIAFAFPFIMAVAEEIYRQAKDIRPNVPDRVSRQREAPFIMASALGALLALLFGIYFIF